MFFSYIFATIVMQERRRLATKYVIFHPLFLSSEALCIVCVEIEHDKC